MLTGRFRLSGLFAVLLALMAQLGAGASVPRIDRLGDIAALCHPGNGPAKAPLHDTDCPLCPLCAITHVQPAALISTERALPPPSVLAIIRGELPPPATAPPSPHRPPTQPRAPPVFS